MRLKSIASGAIFSILSVAVTAMAAQDPAQVYQEALADYNQRSATNLASIDRAIANLAKVENTAADANLNYDILVLESRALYWKGTHLKDQEQVKEVHLQGQGKADAAAKLKPTYADAHYYAGINLARWGEANGILPSLSKLGALKNYMALASKQTTRSGAEGGTVDGYGPSRVLGRIFYKLPVVFGGSRKKSLEHLKTAFDNAKDLALNVVYYAETLSKGSDAEKAEAIKILDELLANNPETYNKDRIPENLEEFKEGQKLRDQL
ncbi:MAG: hypothetical protein HYX41_06335 [Bdellovibrio sp.]|nr:hypothetical protein [Bdellovibrio sp.]